MFDRILIIVVLLLAAHSAAVGHAHRVHLGHLGGAGRHAVLQARAGPSRPRPFRSSTSRPSPRIHGGIRLGIHGITHVTWPPGCLFYRFYRFHRTGVLTLCTDLTARE